MSFVLETNKLTKHYGRIHAVAGLDLEIARGQVFGILGPNGSGKTTTLGMVLGVVQKTSGSYSWFGMGDGFALRRRIGAILEHPIFYPYLSAVDNLRITSHIKKVPNPDVDRLLTMVGLYGRRNDAFRTYSLGMKQRLAIAAALVSDPEVLIFDEPTNGLDPQGIADIRKLIIEIAGMGKTIILASHLLDEVQKVCSHFAVLKNGVKVYQGNVADVLTIKQRLEVGAGNESQLVDALLSHPQVVNIEKFNSHLAVDIREGLTSSTLNEYLFKRGIVVSHLSQVKASLEEQFLEILAEDDS